MADRDKNREIKDTILQSDCYVDTSGQTNIKITYEITTSNA